MNVYSIDNNEKNEVFNLTQRWSNEEGVEVKVQFAHDERHLIVNFEIFENEFRAKTTFHNDSVYEDSCVECFLQNINDNKYINFEFSASSFILAGYGENRYGRIQFDPKKIDKISREVIIYNKEENNVHWKEIIKIDLFDWNLVNGSTLINQKIKGNFNKCGHKLSVPNFFSLFKINTPKPDFHQSESFKELTFL